MRIDHHGNNLNVHVQQQRQAEQLRQAATSQAGSASQPKADVGANPSDPVQHQRLIELLQKSGNEVRQELVVQIRAKLQAGEYQTAAAAEQAASQILGL